ncbi:MAG: group II intron reverse transcriptase/maturase [bacterium]
MRRAGSGQLSFVFADSPEGSGQSETCGAPQGEGWLLHTANGKEAAEPAAQADGSDGGADLLDQAASKVNLAKALLHVAHNQGAAGVDGRSVQEVLEHAQTLLPKLRRELLSGTYQPGAIRRVWIPKPGGGQRGLGIPNVVDRWVQQALLQVLEPVFEPTFHDSSNGFRPQRGAQTAIAEAKEYIADGCDWVVDIDLSKFFDRVNHQRLLGRLAQQVPDGRVLKLVHRMLKAKVVLPDGTVVSTEEGTPQGGPLLPLLSNVVLDELDRELASRGLRFVRYADDFQVYVRSERAGHRVMGSIQRFIERRLRLKVNADKSAVDRPGNVHFLGFSLFRHEEGHVEVILSDRTEQRLNQRIRALTPRQWGSSLNACIGQLNRYLRGWYGYFRLCTERGARRFTRYDARIRRRLRAIIVRQKGRRPRYLYRHLRQCGVSAGSVAKTAFGRRGPWFQSFTYGMHKAYGNTWFHDRVFTLWRMWEREHSDRAWVSSRQLGLFG